MSKYKYNVIWFDDEFESLNIIREKAFLDDIILNGYTNSKDGIEELTRNIEKYDAVIVDGLFYSNNTQNGIATSDKPMFEVASTLDKLSGRKIIPWYILSGQASFTKETNRYADGFKNNEVYDKLNDDHLNLLWNKIKSDASQQIDTQIRIKYHQLFEICHGKYLGNNSESYLLQAIKLLDSDEVIQITKSFNVLRDVLELLFSKLNTLQIIPDGIFKGNGWINKSSLFLSGNHGKYKWKENQIHPIIIFQLYNVIQIVQDASHELPEKLNLKVKQYLETSNSTFLYKSTLFQLIDVLIWFKTFIDENDDIQLNQKMWIEIIDLDGDEWVKGIITRIADNGFGTFLPDNETKTVSIIPTMVNEYHLFEKQTIHVKIIKGDKPKITEIKL